MCASLLAACAGGGAPSGGSNQGGGTPAGGGSGKFVTGYYGEWQQSRYPVSAVDWSALTHVVLHRVGPRAPGPTDAGNPYATISSSFVLGGAGPSAAAAFAGTASAHSVKPILGFGGAYDHDAWVQAASDANRASFVKDVLDASAAWGFAGVDIDWEPMNASDRPLVLALVTALRTEARARGLQDFLVTMPVSAWNMNFALDPDEVAFWRGVEPSVDQLLVMSYCGTGPYGGWSTWHSNPLFGQTKDHPTDVASTMKRWSDDVGIPRAKLALGIGFYGMAVAPPVTGVDQSYPVTWAPSTAYAKGAYVRNDRNEVLEAVTGGTSGGTQPAGGAGAAGMSDGGVTWQDLGVVAQSDDNAMSYGNIQRYFAGKGGAQYVWDDTAKAGYLTWPAPFQADWNEQYGSTPGPITQFVTFEDERSIAAKGAWAAENGFGGAMIWTLNEGTTYPYGADGYANPLLDAVKRAFR